MNDFIHQNELDVADMRDVASESNDPYLLAILRDVPVWATSLINRGWYRELMALKADDLPEYVDDIPVWDRIGDPIIIDGGTYLPVA